MVNRRLLGALVLCVVLAGACATETPPGDGEASSGGPREGGTLVFGLAAGVDGLDPGFTASGTSWVMMNHVFEGLVTRDRTENVESPPVVPGLATEWELSPDGKTYTFTLREGVTFHDGSPFDADAVDFNFKRWMDPEFEYYFDIAAGNTAPLTALIDKTRVVDDYTFEITLKEPTAIAFLDRLTGSSNFYMVSPEAVKQYGNEGQLQHGIGTGPFKIVEFAEGQPVVLERYEDYWGEPTYLDSMVFRPIEDPGARVSALLSGEVDVIMEVPPDSIETINESGAAQVFTNGKPATFALMPNAAEPPFSDPRVRKAVSMAIDRESIAEDLLRGAAEPATQFFGIGNPAHDPALPVQDEYDPEAAAALLSEAGYEEGFRTTMACAPSGVGMPATKEMMEAIQGDLAEINVDVNLELVEWNRYLTEYFLAGAPKGQNFGAMCMAMGTDESFLLDKYANSHSFPPAGFVSGWWENEEADRALNDAAVAQDFDDYYSNLRAAQEAVLEDSGYIYVVHDTGPYGVSNRVQGWQPARSWLQDLSRAWVQE